MSREVRKYYNKGLKNLDMQDKMLDNLHKALVEFRRWEQGATVKLDTFHIVGAANTLFFSLPVLKSAVKKNKADLLKKIKRLSK